MIHMIFELLVSSARIRAYISVSPGACAVIGTAASSKRQIIQAHNFPTVPPNVFRYRSPKKSPEFFSQRCQVARQYTLARVHRQSTQLTVVARPAVPLQATGPI